MRNEEGITLVELLAATAIMGVILVSVMTIIMNSTAETATQGKDSQLLYFAQLIMEDVRSGSLSSLSATGSCSTSEGCAGEVVNPEATYAIMTQPYPNPYGGTTSFTQVTVRVISNTLETRPVELSTVVRN